MNTKPKKGYDLRELLKHDTLEDIERDVEEMLQVTQARGTIARLMLSAGANMPPEIQRWNARLLREIDDHAAGLASVLDQAREYRRRAGYDAIPRLSPGVVATLERLLSALTHNPGTP